MAAKMDEPDQRDQLLSMAEHWEKLAEDRKALVLGHPELGIDDEHEEEQRFR